METMNIAIPPLLKQFVQRRVNEGGYGSVSENVRELIRLEHRQAARDVLEKELLRGVASGPAKKTNADDWAELRNVVKRRAGTHKKR